MRTFVIGDIHGCHIALHCLLDAISPDPGDRLVFLGDYIDRGPGSRQVLDTLMALDRRLSTVFLRGNHEEMMLVSRHNPMKAHVWRSFGGTETLLSYGDPYTQGFLIVPDHHWRFLEKTQRFYETDTHIFVHAGLDPERAMNEQTDWSLFWQRFDEMKPHQSGKCVVCGHTSQRSGEIEDLGYAVCIDTAAVYGGWLTGLEMDSGDYWQTNENAACRQGTLRRG